MPFQYPIRTPGPILGPSEPVAHLDGAGEEGKTFTLIIPPPPAPFSKKVIENFAPRNAFEQASESYWWPRAGPMGIRVNNNLNIPILVQVHVGQDANTGRPLPIPVLEFELSPNSEDRQSLSPDRDRWGPYVWLIVKSSADFIPTTGSLEASLSRLGDL